MSLFWSFLRLFFFFFPMTSFNILQYRKSTIFFGFSVKGVCALTVSVYTGEEDNRRKRKGK